MASSTWSHQCGFINVVSPTRSHQLDLLVHISSLLPVFGFVWCNRRWQTQVIYKATMTTSLTFHVHVRVRVKRRLQSTSIVLHNDL